MKKCWLVEIGHPDTPGITTVLDYPKDEYTQNEARKRAIDAASSIAMIYENGKGVIRNWTRKIEIVSVSEGDCKQ